MATTSIVGELSADALLNALKRRTTATSSKHVIEHLREADREALFRELLARCDGELAVQLPEEEVTATLRFVPFGSLEVIPFFVARDIAAEGVTPNRGTNDFASSLRDYFSVGAERPRVLLTLTPEGNETQRSASDPLIDRELLTLRSLAEQLMAKSSVGEGDPRRRPIELVLDRTPKERPWEETLARIQDFLEVTDDAPLADVGGELPRLGCFYPDLSTDWFDGAPRFDKSELKGADRLEENANCFEVVQRWISNPLVDEEQKITATFSPRAAEALSRPGEVLPAFGDLEPAPPSGKTKNSFDLDGLKVEGALVWDLSREGEAPILLVAARQEQAVRVILPLTEGNQDYVRLVGWDSKKGKPRSEVLTPQPEEGRTVAVAALGAWRRPFEIRRLLITSGPRTLRDPFDELWLVVYQATSPVLAVETSHRPNLEYQAWEPELKASDRAYFKIWSPGKASEAKASEAPVIEVGQEKGLDVDDEDQESLSGDEAITEVVLGEDDEALTARVYWSDVTEDDLDEASLEGDSLESIPYLRLNPKKRDRLLEGLRAEARYLASVDHLSLQGGEWQVGLGSEAQGTKARVRVASHDEHGEDRAVGALLASPETFALEKRAGGEELAPRIVPEAARPALEPYLTARRELFEALRKRSEKLLGFKADGGGPFPLALIDLTACEALVHAYFSAWLGLLEHHTTIQQPFGVVQAVLLDTDGLVELDGEGSLLRLTVLPTHPWLLAAMLRFQKTMTEELAVLPKGKAPKGEDLLTADEVEALCHPTPFDEWPISSSHLELRRVDSSPFHWAFVPQKHHRESGGLGYVRRVVRNRIKRYLQMHSHLAEARRTLRIGFVNPGYGDHLLAGIRDWLKGEHEATTPNIEVLLFHDGAVKEESVGRAFDELFQRKLRTSEASTADEVLLSKLHYTKRGRPCPTVKEKDDYVHICFVHHLLSVDDYGKSEQGIAEGWDGGFGDGLLATPLRRTTVKEDAGSEEQQLQSSRGLWIGGAETPLRRGLAGLLVLIRGRTQGKIQPGDARYWVVDLPTLRNMGDMYTQSDWVVHLDRELSLDMFTVFDESQGEAPPTVIEYSDQEDPQTPGYDTITVTRNAGPYVEQLTSVLELTGLSMPSSVDEPRQRVGLLRDINVLSGSWALDFLLGNIALPSLANRLKGNVGAALVYRWLQRLERPRIAERYGGQVVPIYISLEELIRATPAAGLRLDDGLFQRFSNENEPSSSKEEKLRKICDDLLVLYLTPAVEGRPTRILGRVIEVKFGQSATHAKNRDAAIEQVRNTQKLLREHMSGASSARGAPFRYKQLALLLKTQIEQARCLRVADEATIQKLNIWKLSTDLATGNFRVDYELGGFRGDAFLLSTQQQDALPGDAVVEFMEGVRIIKLARPTLEWLAFQPETAPAQLTTPADTAPQLDLESSWVPGAAPGEGSLDGMDLVDQVDQVDQVDDAGEETPSSSAGHEVDAVPVPEPVPEPVGAPTPVMPLAEAIAAPVVAAPTSSDALLPVLQRLDRALDGHKIKLDEPLKLDQLDQGPRLIRVYARLQAGTTIKSIRSISEDLAREVGTVSADVHICNVPERHSVGIDLPIEGMDYRVTYEQLEAHASFAAAKEALTLGFCAGIDVTGRPIWADLARMPHMLVAGTTGSGKTVFLRSALLTLLQHHSARELSVRMSSSKPMDFMPFTKVPHGCGRPIADDNQSALHLVGELVDEMDRRIKLISDADCDNLAEYNDDPDCDGCLPYIVAVIDEYAETVISFSDKSDRAEFEDGVARLAQKSRAAGIHLILCMQRPDSTVVEGRIKSNILHRFALKLPQNHDSRVILDESGAEALLGKGDLLYKNADGKLFRLQVPFLDKKVLKQRLKAIIQK